MEKKGKENCEFYASLIENLPEGIIIHDLKMVKFVNDTFAKITGYTKNELLLMDPKNLLSEEEKEKLILHAEKRLKGEKPPSHYSAELKRKDGSKVICDFWASPVNYKGERSIFVIVRDITFETEIRERVSELENLLTKVINAANDGIYIRNAKDGRIIYANKKFSEIHGIPLDKLIGMDSRSLLTEKERERLSNVPFSKIPARAELKAEGPNGKKIFIEETAGLIKNKEGEPEYVFGIVRDITKKKKDEEKFKRFALKDPLTGVFNRHFFNEFIYKEWDRNIRFKQPISFILLDVDDFKYINDNFGHLFGDFILKEVAKILKKTLRNSDFIVRFGGDEFLIVLSQTDNGLDVVKKRIEEKLKEWNENNKDKGITISLSCGCSTFYPYKGDTMEKALSEVDRRMYNDKYRKKT